MNDYILFIHPCFLQTSEDCLYLNIFTPLSASPSSNLAVMVFIHGGDFIHLDAGSPMFNGEILVNRSNVILVNINYRLGESRNSARGVAYWLSLWCAIGIIIPHVRILLFYWMSAMFQYTFVYL